MVKSTVSLTILYEFANVRGIWRKRGEPEQGDIGYVMDLAFLGQGFASEASQALLKFGFFETLHLHRITANCDPDNIGSRRVMEKIGLRQEACFRKNMFYKEKWNNTLIYAMLREEYVAK